MKIFFSLLLALSFTINYPAFCFAKSKSAPKDYYGVPVGAQTTKLAAVYPYHKEISISKQFVEKQKAADPVRYELNTIDRKIEKFEDKKEGKHIEKIFWKKPRRRIIPASHVPLYPKES